MTSEELRNFFKENNISCNKFISDENLERFYQNAAELSSELEMFCSLMIDTGKNGHFISEDTWKKLEEYWMCFKTNGKIQLK